MHAWLAGISISGAIFIRLCLISALDGDGLTGLIVALKELINFTADFLGHFAFLRALLGFTLVFFLPGFAWTLVFFKKVTVIERVVLSFGLSIALVILSIFFLNVFVGVKITGINSVIIISFITLIPLAYYGISRLTKPR